MGSRWMASGDDLQVGDAAEHLVEGFGRITGIITSLSEDEAEIRVPQSLRYVVVPREDAHQSRHYRRDERS